MPGEIKLSQLAENPSIAVAAGQTITKGNVISVYNGEAYLGAGVELLDEIISVDGETHAGVINGTENWAGVRMSDSIVILAPWFSAPGILDKCLVAHKISGNNLTCGAPAELPGNYDVFCLIRISDTVGVMVGLNSGSLYEISALGFSVDPVTLAITLDGGGWVDHPTFIQAGSGLPVATVVDGNDFVVVAQVAGANIHSAYATVTGTVVSWAVAGEQNLAGLGGCDNIALARYDTSKVVAFYHFSVSGAACAAHIGTLAAGDVTWGAAQPIVEGSGGLEYVNGAFPWPMVVSSSNVAFLNSYTNFAALEDRITTVNLNITAGVVSLNKSQENWESPRRGFAFSQGCQHYYSNKILGAWAKYIDNGALTVCIANFDSIGFLKRINRFSFKAAQPLLHNYYPMGVWATSEKAVLLASTLSVELGDDQPQTNSYLIRIIPNDYVAIAISSGGAGESVKIAFGERVDGLAGLDVGKKYYGKYDGTLTPEDTGVPVGIALSTTSLMMLPG
jgi:hypothetical protein